ncbi:hypothetical protein X975_20150, partial [Stegodyphus mimosarum]
MVWGAIVCNTRSPLVLFRGTMTAQRYVHEILQPHVLPLMQRLPGAIFQQDNARPHTARVSQDCLLTVATLPWPARSPDLKFIHFQLSMAYLAKGKKQDLIELAETQGVVILKKFRIRELSNAIITSPTYDAEFAKECLNRIRKETKTEQRAEREKEN